MNLKKLFSSALKKVKDAHVALRQNVRIVAAIILTSPLVANAALPENIMKEILTSPSVLSLVRGVLTVIALTLTITTIYMFTQGDKAAMISSGIVAGVTAWMAVDWDTFVGFFAG